MRYKFQSRQGKIEIEKTLFFCAHFSINPLNHVTFFTVIGTSALFFFGGGDVPPLITDSGVN